MDITAWTSQHGEHSMDSTAWTSQHGHHSMESTGVVWRPVCILLRSSLWHDKQHVCCLFFFEVPTV